MLVFVACIKHPNNSQSYNNVWRQLNNTLFSVCSQHDEDFRVIVVCDKKLPLFHHEELINQYTDFIEVDFPSHDESVLDNFERLGTLSPPLADAFWWLRWDENDFAEGRPDGFFHIANVYLNMGTKLLIGIVAAKKYEPDYVAIFDGDDYVGNDLSAYANAHPKENGWIMAYGYKISGNRIAPMYEDNSFCGTGNIISYALLTKFIGTGVSETSTQNELFKHIDSELILTIANHKKIKPFFERHGIHLLEFPTRSALYQVSHLESSEHTMMILRGKSTQRFQQTKRYGKITYLSAPLINYFNILASNSQKVFCLGFHKTGTTSLEILLQDMEYQVASPYKNWDSDLTEKLERGDLSELKEMAALFDAFQDAPWFLFFKEFDQWFPNSKFILTIRDSHSWWKSFLNYFENTSNPLFKYIYGYENPKGHEKTFVERFEKHNHDVLEYFKDRPDDLLVIEIGNDNILTKVIDFLGKRTTLEKTPHANAALRTPSPQRKKRNSGKLTKIKDRVKRTRNRLAFITTGTASRAPIIVGGCKVSGTELVLSILSGHPNIYAVRNQQLNYPAHHPLSLGARRDSISLSPKDKNAPPIDLAYLKQYIIQDKRKFSALRWSGTNRLNILLYQELLNYYGKDLRIINVVRDGRDVIVENDSKIMERQAVKPERWVYDIQEGIKFESHPQVFTIRYEDLIQNPEKTVTTMAEFIGEKNIKPFLRHPEGARIVEPYYWIGKWQLSRYAKRVEQFLQTPGAQECLRHYGYLE